jgi:hypothetical protein
MSRKIVFYEFFIYFIKSVVIFTVFNGNIQYFRSIEKNNIMLKNNAEAFTAVEISQYGSPDG